jgi:hypothetical protein
MKWSVTWLPSCDRDVLSLHPAVGARICAKILAIAEAGLKRASAASPSTARWPSSISKRRPERSGSSGSTALGGDQPFILDTTLRIDGAAEGAGSARPDTEPAR